MDSRATARGAAAGELIVSGLGPGDLSRLPSRHRDLLEDPDLAVVVRTLHHPAAAQLAELRAVETCDDLYDRVDEFDGVYRAIVDRVLERASSTPTIYAVPGSPLVGEFAVRMLLEAAPDTEVIPAESFVDAVLRAVGYDPLDRGLRIIDGHHLPNPVALDAPTIVAHLDAPEVLADVTSALSRVLPSGSEVTVCANLGAGDEQRASFPVDGVPPELAGFRTSLFIDTVPAGLVGLVGVMRRLRAECPWDRRQTHSSLIAYLLEEVYELIDAIAALPEELDHVAYDGVEEELGDVLLQVLFHAAIAAEKGVFGIDDVATRLQEKLVRRHPHVFAQVQVADADEVATNWNRIKSEEKGPRAGSLMDGIPVGLPALERAGRVQRKAAQAGFDWEDAADVVDALRSEVDELAQTLAGEGDTAHELGDVVFAAVNLMRHLDLDGEIVLRRATDRFERRFRAMESAGPLEGLSSEGLEARWHAAKADQG